MHSCSLTVFWLGYVLDILRQWEDKVRFGFITLGKNVPSTRFRFLPYFPYLHSRGHSCRLWMSYPSVYEHIPWLGWRVSHTIKRANRYRQSLSAQLYRPDSIYLERGCLNDDSLDLDRRFRKLTPRLVLDIDDGIFLERPDKIDQLIAISDHCIVSNEPIADYVRQRHQHVTLIPTAVSMQRYRPKPSLGHSQVAPPVIGWIGTVPTMAFLEVCSSALRQLAEHHEFELLVVGPSPKPLQQIDLRGVQVRFEPWNAAKEIDHLHQMDIGIMPLPAGQAWMRYKAATKLVQYLAIGIPAVASPIGVNQHILEGNQVGFAAITSEQWYETLQLLLKNAQLRQELGRAGRELVTRKYSIEANAPILEQVLTGIIT